MGVNPRNPMVNIYIFMESFLQEIMYFRPLLKVKIVKVIRALINKVRSAQQTADPEL